MRETSNRNLLLRSIPELHRNDRAPTGSAFSAWRFENIRATPGLPARQDARPLRQPWTAVVIAAFHLIQDEQHTGLEKKCLTPMAAVPITAIGVPIVGLRNPLSRSLRLAGCARQKGPPPLLDRALPHGSYCVPQFHERSFAIRRR